MNYENNVPKKPTLEFRQATRTWHLWYKDQFVIPYFYSGKDFQNLKYLLRKLKETDTTLEDFLSGIESAWHIENASIPLFNSHFNTLIKQKSSKHPNLYSYKYEKTLEQHELADYWKHLLSIGFKRSYSPGGGSTWTK